MAIYESGSAAYPAGPDGPALAYIRPMPRWLVVAIVVSTILYTAFSLHIPVGLLADAGLDDGLFVQNAGSLIAGHWLGPYSDTTLAKGPGFSFFLALNALLGVPVTFSIALLYSGACALVATTLYRIFGAAWLSLFSFLLMQWHPAMIPFRIIRDDLSGSQALIVLACVCHFVFLPSRLRIRLLWGAASGVALAWFWMTREDGIWILPGLALIVLLQAFRLWPWRREVLRLAVPVGGAGIAMVGTLCAVAAVNLAVYGTFTVVDFKSRDFAQALNVLQSVRVGDPVPFVPVPAKVRAAVDKVSPTFASLEPYLKGEGRVWEAPGCAIYPSTCSDFAGGWFMWALRDAVFTAGDYASPQVANSFYHHLWEEVHAACVSGKLQCHKSLLPFMPGMQPQQWALLPPAIRRLYGLATWQGAEGPWFIAQHRDLRSEGTAAQLDTMEKLLRNPLRLPAASEGAATAVSGWFHRPDNMWLRVHCGAAQGNVVLPVIRRPSPDLVSYFHAPNAGSQRFVIEVPSMKDCWFEPATDGGDSARFALAGATPGVVPFTDGLLSIDTIGPVAVGQSGGRSLALFSRISTFYGRFLPPATILALVIYLAYIARAALHDRRRRLDPLLIMVSGIGALLLARAAILLLVDISSFPAVVPLYWGAGYPLLALAIVLAFAEPFRPRLR